MPGRVVSGEFVTTPHDVYEMYRPRTEYVSAQAWQEIRTLAVASCRAAEHSSVDAALISIRATGQFLAWCRRDGIALSPEAAFQPDHVERYIATQTRNLTVATSATYRSHLRRVGRASTRRAPWPAPPRAYARPTPMTGPYSTAEVAGFLEAVDLQPSELWRRRLSVFLTLGLGAGLRPGEHLGVRADRDLRVHHDDPRLWVVALPGRTVPVRAEYVDRLRELSRVYPEGPLIGAHRADIKNPQGVLMEGFEFRRSLPPLRLFRLRITWMVNVLQSDVRISEFAHIAGVVSAKTLETIAPYVPGRWDDNVWLKKAAGL